MSRTVKLAVAMLAAALVIAAVGAVVRARGSDAARLMAYRDEMAALDSQMFSICDQISRGWRPKDAGQQLVSIAEQAREHAAHFRAIANQRHSPAYQDMADWALATADFAQAARRLGPDPGKPGYRDVDAEIDRLTSLKIEAEGKAFSPEILEEKLESTNEMIAAMVSAGFDSEQIARDKKMLQEEAHRLANDTPAGRAARKRAEQLGREIDALQTERPYTSADMRPYLDRLEEAAHRAMGSIAYEARYGTPSPSHTCAPAPASRPAGRQCG